MTKRITSILLAIIILVNMIPAVALAADTTHQPFTDVKAGDWYYDYVTYVREKGLFSGVENNKFAPEGSLTRAMFVTVLGRLAKVDTAAYTKTVFDDVAPDSWYGPYVAWAAEKGISTGVGAGRFAPDANITREQMATFVYRYLNLIGKLPGDVPALTYADADSISAYAREAVAVCLALEIMMGDDTNAFRPGDNANRAEAAAIFARFDQHLSGDSKPSEDTEHKEDDSRNTVSSGTIAGGSGNGGSGNGGTTVESVTFHEVVIGYPADMTEEDKDATRWPEAQIVLKGDLVYSLPTPYREGYIFAGWFYDSALSVLADTDDVITKNMTVYPRMVRETDADTLGKNYFNYVAAIDAEPSYRVTVQAPSAAAVRNGISFFGVSDGMTEMPFTVTDNGNGTYTIQPTDGLKSGKTYQLTAIDREILPTPENPIPAEDEYVLFIHEGEVQSKDIRYYNIFVKGEEIYNMRIDDDVAFIELSETSGFGMTEAAGLYSMRMDSGGEVSLMDNAAEGTFTYNGTPALRVGQIVAIHKGGYDPEDGFDNNAEVAYIEITKADGNTYSYVSADPTDVIFMPDVIPVPYAADMDGDRENNTMTLDIDILDFSLFENQEILNADTVVGPGDYIALYEGSLSEATSPAYAEILTMEKDEAAGTVTFTIKASSKEELEASLDTYSMGSIDAVLSKDEIVELENKLVEQGEKSGFGEEAARFMLTNRLGMPEELEYGQTYTMNEQQMELFGIEVDGGNIMYQVEIGRPNVKASISSNLKKITQVEDAEGRRITFGVTVPVGIEVVENGWHVIESLTMDLYISFEQEFALNTRFSVDDDWDYYWGFIPYLDEVTVDAGFTLGTYTGLGAIITASTEKYYEKSYLWKELAEPVQGTFNSSSNIAEKLNEMLARGDVSFFGEVGDEGELVEMYADMLQREIDYFDILALPIFHSKGYLDKFHIVNYVLDIELIFAAKLNVAMGMSFENLSVKEYSFHFEMFAGRKNHYVLDKQTPYTNFNFFVFGNLGARAGIGFTFSVGLVSVKLDNIGVHFEFGPYIELYGFYYYHYDKVGNAPANIKTGGAVYVEIGVYLALDFFAGAFLDLLSVEVHLVDESWKIYGAGTEWYTVKAAEPESDVTVYGGENFSISDYYFQVREFNILTGEWRTSNRSIDKYEEVTPSTYARSDGDAGKITYNSKTKKFEVNADYTDTELSADFTFVMKGSNPLIEPVTKTVHVHWVKTDPKFAVEYRTGTISNRWSEAEGAWVSAPIIDNSKTELITEGSIMPALKNYELPLQGFDFVGWRIDCPAMPEVHGKLLHEVNYMQGQIMPQCNIALDPVRSPRSDTHYTVRHWLTSLDKEGEYDLFLEEDLVGKTNDYITDYNFLDIPGVKLDYDKYPYRDVTTIEHDGKTYIYVQRHYILYDGSTVVDIYYNRENYVVSLHTNTPLRYELDGDTNTYYMYSLAYGEEIPSPSYADHPYLLGWSTTPDGPVEFTKLPSVAEGEERIQDYYAVWDMGDVDVTVNYYAYDPRTNQTDYKLVASEVRPVPRGKLNFKYGLTAEAGRYPELNDLSPYKYEGYYADGRTYTKGHIGFGDENITYNVYYTGSFRQMIFGTDISYYHYGDEITIPDGPAKPGYEFIGWYPSGRPNSFYYSPGQTIRITNSEHLEAVYQPSGDTPYVVNHHYETVNKGSYDTPEVENLTGTTDVEIRPEVKPRTGYDSPAVQTVTIKADGSTVVNYYYDRSTYGIRLDADGGIVRGQHKSSYRYGVDFFLFDNGFQVTKEGKTFIGWYLQGDETQTLLDEYTTVTGAALESCGELVFVAKYDDKPIEYHTEHYLEQADGSYILQQTDRLTGSLESTVTATAADFAGFSLDEDNPGNVTKGTIASESETVVLKLYYNRNTYTATWLDYDGTTVLGTANFKYGETVVLPGNIAEPQRDMYRFDGWKSFGTMPAKSVEYSAAEYGNWTSLAGPYDLIFDFNGESMRHYTDWELQTYDCEDQSFEVGYLESLNQYFAEINGGDFMQANYPGYTFKGWYDENGNLYDGNNTMPAGNLTLTAEWEPMEVEITLWNGDTYGSWGSPNGETVTVTASYGDIIDIPDHGFTNEGYFIAGWNTGDGSGGPGQGSNISNKLVLVDDYYEQTVLTETPRLDIHPVWLQENEKCTISFNGNGGIGFMADQYGCNTYYYTALNFNTFTREGYRFIGWTTTESYDEEVDWLITDGSSFDNYHGPDNVTLYAQWEAIE